MAKAKNIKKKSFFKIKIVISYKTNRVLTELFNYGNNRQKNRQYPKNMSEMNNMQQNMNKAKNYEYLFKNT